MKTTEELKHVPFEMYARVLARAEQAEAQLAEAKSALSAKDPTIWDLRKLFDEASNIVRTLRDRLASLEKSVTVLRAENVELREIAGGLSYYADGHGLQEKWAAELRSLNQRLGALAQATDQPSSGTPRLFPSE